MQSYIRSAKYSEGFKKISSHYHDTHQILYVTKGSAEITVNNVNFSLEEGSLIFISRMEAHSINSVNHDYSRYEIRISPEILSSSEKDLRLYSVLLNRPVGFNRIINLPKKEIAGVFEEITCEYKNQSPYKDEMVSLLLDKLFIYIYRKYPEMFSATNIPYFETVYKIQRKFEEELSEAHSLALLSEEFHLSKYYLSHIFKDVTGYSVMDYLKNLRIAKAKSLLAKSNISIFEIVKICGFSDSNNFSRDFKAITGLSPRDFRKNSQV